VARRRTADECGAVVDDGAEDTAQRIFGQQAGEALSVLAGYGQRDHHREIERVRVAVLKLSKGALERLRYFVDAADKDYRDVLWWAEEPES